MSEPLDLALQAAGLNIGHFSSIVKVFNNERCLPRNFQILGISITEFVLSCSFIIPSHIFILRT